MGYNLRIDKIGNVWSKENNEKTGDRSNCKKL